MALLDIAIDPHPILRGKAQKITQFDDELQTLIDNMIETMRDAPGVGLAAPQVHQSRRLFVAEFGDENDEEVPPQVYVFVNPKIVTTSREMATGAEGCLSIPGKLGDVMRPLNATIEGLDRYGKPQRIEAAGWLARIFQHETDHLNGILFTDHALKVWEQELPEIE